MIMPSGISTYSYAQLASGKGWGPGWPNCGPGPTQTVTLARSGTKLYQIHVKIARLVELIGNEIERRGYLFVPGWCWGGQCRSIAGSNTPSNHSWFLAVDINAPKNPYTSTGQHDIPDWVYAIWRAYGFGCGADYSGKKDWMHVEAMGSPTDMAIMTQLAERAFGGGAAPAPAPAAAPAPVAAPAPAPAPAQPAAPAYPGTLLRRGSTGNDVRVMQARLKMHCDGSHYPTSATFVDGDFGPHTEAAVKWFQTARNLGADGIVGPMTWGSLWR